MKTALNTALFSRITGTNFEFLTGGRLYPNEAPEGVTDPYATYQIISYTNASTFTETLYDILVQFSIFSTAGSQAEINAIESALNDPALFNDQRFQFSGGTVISMFLEQSDGPKKMLEETEDGESSYWQTDCDYNITIQKN